MWRAARMAWVDILLDQNSIAKVIGFVANSQTFEMQAASKGKKCSISEAQKTELLRLRADIRHYQAYLPEATASTDAKNQPSDSLDQTLPLMKRSIESWLAHVHPLAEKSKRLNTQLMEWRFLERCLKQISQNLPDQELSLESFNKTIRHKPVIGMGTDKGLSALQDNREVLLQSFTRTEEKQLSDEPDSVFVGLMPHQDSAMLERTLRATGTQFAKMPADLSGSPEQALLSLQLDMQNLQAQLEALKSEIDQHSTTDQIKLWNGQMQRWLWLSEVMNQAWCDERFVQICGWVPEQKLEVLEQALRDSAGPYLLHRGEVGAHGEPPVLLDNPAWMKPFESFVRGFGVPRSNQIDPTPLLALTTPIMFGFMFGDVGHGLILVLLGYILRNRLPILGLLVPAGISATVFGFLYGSVFCYEDLFQPIWLHPLDHPLTVMGVALLFGAAMLLASLVLAGVQAWWERRITTWLARQLPLIILCLTFPSLFWNTTLATALAVSALLVALVFALFRSGWSGALLAFFTLLEDGMQLAINMLSFIRLGAFTLAHGGLSSAVMVLVMIPENAFLQILIFILGNVLVIALEGLVVSIQTTRLVMFEFFRRFMEGAGRPFKPLTDPAIT